MNVKGYSLLNKLKNMILLVEKIKELKDKNR